MSKNPVIIFEGIEASGKSTNLNFVASYLKKKGKKFIKLREPGGSKFSEQIRKMLLNKNLKLDIKTDLLLFFSARSENFKKIIKKNYKKRIILIDRFTDSTIAYQHYGMGVDINLIKTLNKFLLKNINVDFTFLNLVNNKNLYERLKKRKSLNRYDKFNMKFYNKVQRGFVKLSNINNRKYQLINSNLNIENNEKLILNKIDKLIK